jgi:glycine oxidase
LGLNLQIQPVRGQIVLLRRRSPPIDCVVNEQLRYIVPRDDGRVLVGATVEHAGFDCRTTATGVAGLLQFGMSLVPALSEAVVEKTWAGLRPGTPDGAPYLDRIEGLANGFVAAGHYRSGLVLSPGTAVVMSQLMRGETPEIALKPFRADRDAGVR